MNANMQGSTAQVVDGAMQPVTTAPALLTGKIKIANDLYAVFANDTGEQRKFSVIFDAALNVKFTPQEMDDNLKAAQTMADEADKRDGFTPAVGAKGTAKYGPKRQAMNVRSSEIRQLFGALLFTNIAATHADDGHEVTPKVTKDTGFTAGVKLARQALKENGINWDNTPVLTPTQKTHIQAAKLEGDVKAKWIAAHPQEAGESMRDYAERMEEALLDETAKALAGAQAEKVKAMAAAFIKKHGLDFAAEVAQAIITQYNETVAEEVQDTQGDAQIVAEGEERADAEVILN